LYQNFGNLEHKTDGKITVSTLQEAEFFAASKKFSEILYAVPIVFSKLNHASSIHSQVKFTILVDSFTALEQLEEFCKKNSSKIQKWNVVLKIDCGYHRVGVDPKNPTSFELAKKLHNSPFINFRGIYTHSGHSYKAQGSKEILEVAEEERKVASEFAIGLKNMGILCEIVAVGSTPACSLSTSWEGITEIHPGNYIFYDRFQASIGSCSLDDVSCSILTSVIGHYPERNTILIDAGSLALSKDTGPSLKNNEKQSWGVIRGSPHLKITSLSQECGIVESDGSKPLNFNDYPIGSHLQIIPNHACLAAACFPKYSIEKNGKLVGEWMTCPPR